MRTSFLIICFLLLCGYGRGQVLFKTIVPATPVVAGESFPVQYVLEGEEKTGSFKAPVFSSFRTVAGPQTYTGSVAGTEGQRPLRNMVFTLEALKPGVFIIPGATILINGRPVRSNDARVQVISPEEALRKMNPGNSGSASGYFLKPGEDPYKKIRENLFVKVQVDRRSCYTGEPVLATFKLYSRLESKSDIVKNPGFYGFTVHDMVNLSDKQVRTETVNGKIFDVHTIRQVQLYPLQPGNFTVDAMQVRNKVEFSRSTVNKKTEQEIVEGIYGTSEEEEPHKEGATVYESSIHTEPVSITVKPLPEKNRPAGYDGATGRFTITASLVKKELARGEEGYFDITVSGKGNFIQLAAPSVEWPDGVEGFDPVVRDNLDKATVPLRGNRTFRFPFVCAAAGNYQLPAVQFSFFDTDSNKYRPVQTSPLSLHVTDAVKKEPPREEKVESISTRSEQAARKAGIIVLLLVASVLFYWFLKGKGKSGQLTPAARPAAPGIGECLAPALNALEGPAPVFYKWLQEGCWQWLSGRFELSGSGQSKAQLREKMRENGIGEADADQLVTLLLECETALYTGVEPGRERENLLMTIQNLLEKIAASN